MKSFWRTRLTAGAVATACAAALAAAGLAQRSSVLYPAQPAAADTAHKPMSTVGAAPLAGRPLPPLDELSATFAAVSERVKPSVVYITATPPERPLAERGTAPDAPTLPGLPPEFRQFFRGLPIIPDMPRGQGTSSGSGFIISPDGYILTNAHVIDGADRVTVRLLDRREFKAKVVGRDPTTDIAVVKIDAAGLTSARLGDSDAARVGDWVLAVGNPLGDNLTFTVTQGIISAKGRGQLALPNSSRRSIQDFIQTDAAINPGNSGGPLVNVRGEVIGINTAIASPTGFNAGYGFAVPINLARAVMDQLIKTGRVERAALGILVRDASPEDAEYAGLRSVSGVLVQDYGSDHSPAKRAGIQPGDVIVSVDGKPVEYVAQLQEAIAFRKPGDVVSVEVARKGGRRETVRMPLQRAEEDRPASVTGTNEHDDDANPARGTVSSLGISVVPADEATAREFALPADARGLVVTEVDESSPASGRLAALGSGGPDVILSVEDTPVPTVEALRSALRDRKPGEIVTLRVYNAPSKVRRVERVRLGGDRR